MAEFVYVLHCVNSAGNLKQIKESEEKKYPFTVDDAIGKINWEVFAMLKYPKKDSYCNWICFALQVIHPISFVLCKKINFIIIISWQDFVWPIIRMWCYYSYTKHPTCCQRQFNRFTSKRVHRIDMQYWFSIWSSVMILLWPMLEVAQVIVMFTIRHDHTSA